MAASALDHDLPRTTSASAFAFAFAFAFAEDALHVVLLPVSRAPHGSTVLFSDTFSDSNWCGYNRVQNQKYTGPACGYHDTSYSLRSVDGAARFEVRPGDSPGGGL